MTPVQWVEVAMWLGGGWAQVELIGSSSSTAAVHVGISRQRQQLTNQQHLQHTTTTRPYIQCKQATHGTCVLFDASDAGDARKVRNERTDASDATTRTQRKDRSIALNYGTFVPRNFRSQEPSFRGTFVPKSEIYMELSFPNSMIIIL